MYATAVGRGEPAVRSRYISGILEQPRDDQVTGWLRTLRPLHGDSIRPLLLGIDDLAVAFMEDHREELSSAFALPQSPAGLRRRLGNKRALWELCQRLGIPAPASSFPSSEHELSQHAADRDLPLVLKRTEAWLPSYDPAAPSVWIASTRTDLIDAYRRMESPLRPQVMMQEYIPGGSETVWMFNGYFDRDSRCLCAFTGQKLRQRGPKTGPTTLGICTWNPEVAQAAIRLMSDVGYQGIVDMGFRYDERDGQYKLLDVNPRLGSTFRLFVGDNGIDVVRAAYLDLTGQPVPPTRAADGRRWMAEPHDIVACAQLAREGALTAEAWLRSLRGIEEGAWWANDDPAPFLAMCASLPSEALRFGARRRRRSRWRSVESVGESEVLRPAA